MAAARPSSAAQPDPIERLLALLEPEPRAMAEASLERARLTGYLDLLGEREVPARGTAQRLMQTSVVPPIYERWWRPALGRVAKGALGPGMRDEVGIARELLALAPGDGVLDVACGPGNFTRDFARVVGPEGLAVGIDASATMLERAGRDTPPGLVAYLRGDAVRLPFRDESFDAVCCFAALNLFDEPFLALDHMVRVLTPGGRIAIFTSCRRRFVPRAFELAVAGPAGIRIFGREEIAGAVRDRGLAHVQQRISGLTQFVGARKS